MSDTPLTILDLVPISTGSDATLALRNSIDLAQRAEAFGCWSSARWRLKRGEPSTAL